MKVGYHTSQSHQRCTCPFPTPIPSGSHVHIKLAQAWEYSCLSLCDYPIAAVGRDKRRMHSQATSNSFHVNLAIFNLESNKLLLSVLCV